MTVVAKTMYRIFTENDDRESNHLSYNNYERQILYLDSMCYVLIAYVVKALKMAIIVFQTFFFCPL